jgi:DNA end-binding protein Ku
MYTLRHASEVRSMGAIDELKQVPAKMKPDEIRLARQVIGNFETGGDLTQYKDEYQEQLRQIIDAKIEGREVVSPAEEAPPKVVNLMEALRQSLERVSAGKKRTAKIADESAPTAAAKAPARKRARG